MDDAGQASLLLPMYNDARTGRRAADTEERAVGVNRVEAVGALAKDCGSS